MNLKKNDEIELTITDLGSNGEGIGRYEGMAFFINGAVIGDRIIAGITKLNKSYGFARIVRILEPSPLRTEPACPIAKRCGGCQLQYMSYEGQLEYKQNKVKNAITRIGGFTEEELSFEPIIGMDVPLHYRNKGQFPVGIDKSGRVVSGFYAERTHSIIETDSCIIQHELTDSIMQSVRQFITENGISVYDEGRAANGDVRKAGLIRHILTRIGFTTHEVMVCVVINGKTLPKAPELIERLKTAVEGFTGAEKYELASVTININTENTNVILGNECKTLYGEGYITDFIGDIRYRISPLSFYQVNPVQTKKLYSTALEFAGLTGNETVWDIYCGIGTISLFLAQKAKHVYGVEIVPQAIDDARENAKMNGISNADFFVGAAEEVLPEKYAANPEMRADVIVVDPPRKGCDEKLLECICKLEPKRIVYVSCDPATLARDMKYLNANGYAPERVRPCDMFPQSSHVETVVLMSRVK